MGINEELRDATDALTREVHALGERLSAKELLHRRTRRLTQLAFGVAVVTAAVAFVAVVALVRVNGFIECQGKWAAASSQRQDVLNDFSKARDYQKGLRDQAHRTLVDFYGTDPGSDVNRKAVELFDTADDDLKAAERAFDEARDEYPPPLLHEYCENVPAPEKPDVTPSPKAQGSQAPPSRAPQGQPR